MGRNMTLASINVGENSDTSQAGDTDRRWSIGKFALGFTISFFTVGIVDVCQVTGHYGLKDSLKDIAFDSAMKLGSARI